MPSKPSKLGESEKMQLKNRLRSLKALKDHRLLPWIWHRFDCYNMGELGKFSRAAHSAVASMAAIYQHRDLRKRLIVLAREEAERRKG